jgi:Coenzyme PQQ synthesis protein D (PqqD)
MNLVMPNIHLDTKILAAKDVLSAELGDEISLLNVKSGTYFTLNTVGASVWRQIQVTTSLARIKAQILSEYDVEDQCCERDLRQLVADLEASGLIELVPG